MQATSAMVLPVYEYTPHRAPRAQPRGHQPYQLARALDILQGRRDGVTFTALAERHGVTITRIH